MRNLLRAVVPVALSLGALSASATASEWLTSYSKASAISHRTGKPILVDFTGSDWCVWCHRLDDEVFSKPAFKQWASKRVVLLKLDFPRKKKLTHTLLVQNQNLARKYRIEGFPTVLFLNGQGAVLGKYGYDQGGPENWTKNADLQLSSFRPMRLLQSKPVFPPYVKAKELYADNDFRGKTAPKLEVAQWLTGKAPNTKGKVVLVDFWATWCPPCRELIPELTQWQEKFKNDLVVIGVSDEDAATVKKFMGTTKMDYNVGVDPQHRTAKIIGIKGIPHVLVITPDGIVRWQGFSGSAEDPLTEAKLRQIIASAKSLPHG